MNAARVVADHAADGAVIVRRRIGAEREAMLLGGISEIVEYDARLDARKLLLWVELGDAVHILREIHDHRNVATLPGERCAAAACQDQRPTLPRARDGAD